MFCPSLSGGRDSAEEVEFEFGGSRGPSRSACGALADGAPLGALQAHAALLRAPWGAVNRKALHSLLASGDRLARALAIRPLARVAESDFDTTLSALAGDDDLL